VPVFITHRKDLKKDGANPTMLSGYGGFDISDVPRFQPEVIALLERGGVLTANSVAAASTAKPGTRPACSRRNSTCSTTSIAAAEYLVRERYARRRRSASWAVERRLARRAVEQQRPDLFAVALPAVGVMDMLRYHKFTGGAAWATEYGSSENAKDFGYLYKYSPLHNVKAGTCYPATLVTTADHDDRVVPSHSFKFAATMQAAQRCDKPVLIRVETQGSHGYRPTDKRIAELAGWAFALGL
jgi:prolyl oligopeptidase